MTFPAATLFLVLSGPAGAQEAGAPKPGERYTERIPGTLTAFDMIPVPGGTVQLETPEGPRIVQVEPFWIAATETSWDFYDIYVFGLDKPAETGADAVTRPTRPYVLPGDAFGHEGRPALGMSFHAAKEFAKWVSAVTGKSYRIPTEAEWVLACRLGVTAPEPGRPLPDAPPPDVLEKRAWFKLNAQSRTQPVGKKQPDRLGVHDLLGNVAEWVAGIDGDSVAMGGAWNDTAEHVRCSSRKSQTPAWNETDPQLPKSRWWLPDAVFVGFRLVR